MRDSDPSADAAELPRVLIFCTALTCGVLAGLAVELNLARVGYDLGAFWRNSASAKALLPWWALAGAAFIVSGAAAALLSRLPPPWHRFRVLRWGLAGLAVLALAASPSSTTVGSEMSAGVQVTGNLAALGLAGLMATVGAYFTVRR